MKTDEFWRGGPRINNIIQQKRIRSVDNTNIDNTNIDNTNIDNKYNIMMLMIIKIMMMIHK